MLRVLFPLALAMALLFLMPGCAAPETRHLTAEQDKMIFDRCVQHEGGCLILVLPRPGKVGFVQYSVEESNRDAVQESRR